MSNEPSNPHAFPVAHLDSAGMTLRDWFAGQALAGWMATYGDVEPSGVRANTAAELAYRVADAMLKAREGGK